MAAFNMTLAQAQQAAALATQISGLQQIVAQLQAGIAAGATISSMSAGTSVGQLNASVAMSATDSATVLTAVLMVVANDLTAATAALAAIGT